MPDAKEALDLLRFDELGRQADLAVNLWTAFGLACERGDSEIVRHHGKQLAVLTRSALALVNRLGNPEPDTPFARDAKAWRGERGNG
jgi:hypothetical protein